LKSLSVFANTFPPSAFVLELHTHSY